MNKLVYLPILLLISCALYAQDTDITDTKEEKHPGENAFVMSQMAVYSQGLAQPDGSLLVAQDFTYASEGIDFYNTPEDDLYIENGGNLIKFSPDKPALALVQGVWNGYPDLFAEYKLGPYRYQPKKAPPLTFYCNKEKTQYITLTDSRKPADCDGCDYVAPYDAVWHDDKLKKTKKLKLAKEITPEYFGPPEYVFCQGDVFYYETNDPQDPAKPVWCEVIRAHHISTGKDEIFISLPAEKCGAKLSGPMAVPGTDYLLYQISDYKKSNTQLFMKKGLK